MINFLELILNLRSMYLHYWNGDRKFALKIGIVASYNSFLTTTIVNFELHTNRIG